ncbi:hypothetical protein BV25DRAFT_1180850 [Artomyces pyxidatus]|uniref:Uncharacterized protein n=1 Tax=Artomyces pyxidatus TaxID=48021 RepID=A0ACB8SRF9_9AGAM|nr:hypothetical protein BV25DRAFT_1180850 [Artomyces pyxidatus]
MGYGYDGQPSAGTFHTPRTPVYAYEAEHTWRTLQWSTEMTIVDVYRGKYFGNIYGYVTEDHNAVHLIQLPSPLRGIEERR